MCVPNGDSSTSRNNARANGFLIGPTVLIYNPAAGGLRRKRGRVERVAAILTAAGHSLTVTPTSGPGSATEIARQAVLAGAKLIAVAGGDGTLNEAAAGMAGSRVPLAILPAGTANVLATELGLRPDLEQAANLIPACTLCRIALGRLEGASGIRYFLSMAGAGFDAQIVHGVSPGLKARLGKSAYWIGGFSQAVRRFPEFEVQLDGNRTELSSFALVTRVRNYGGDFEIARETTLLDDRFEVILFRGRYSPVYLKYLCGMIAGRLAGMRGVRFLRAHRVCISDPSGRVVHTQVDGEYAGTLPVSIEIVQDALTLLVPPAYLESGAVGGTKAQRETSGSSMA